MKKYAAACCKCGKETTIDIFRSVNVSEDPQMKDKVKSGAAFMWTCPHCGTRNLVRYEMLYHDPARKLMLWLLPDEQMEAKAAEMAAIEKAVESMGNYTLRRCSDAGSVIEKILIDEAGLSDIAVELLKWVTRSEMAQNDPSLADVQLKFYKVEGDRDSGSIILSFPKDGAMTGCTVGWNVYEDCLGIISRQADKLRPAKGFALIDSDWMNMRMA